MRHARLRWLTAVLVVTALTGVVHAQEPGYAFGGGGPGLGLFMPDLSEINAFVEGAGFPTFDGDLFLVGGGGRGGVVPGPVFGGAGWERGSNRNTEICTLSMASASADSISAWRSAEASAPF